MDPVQLALDLVELRRGLGCALDADRVNQSLEAPVQALEIVAVRQGAFPEMFQDAGQELVEGPQRSKAIGQCGIPNAR